MIGYTLYKGVKNEKELREYLETIGDLPECESFQRRSIGDFNLAGDGFIADENFDDDLWATLPETLFNC